MPTKPEDIFCFERGSPDVKAWSGYRGDLAVDWAALQFQVERGAIEMSVHGERVNITGGDRVGLIVLPSGRRLVIRSKISSLTLLEWLSYLGMFPRLTSWLHEAGIAAHATGDDDWHLCIAKLFLIAMDRVTRRYLRKDYVSVVSNEPELRGRICIGST